MKEITVKLQLNILSGTQPTRHDNIIDLVLTNNDNIINYYTLNYLFSDWSKAYSELSKSAPVTSSSCRLYDNHVKDTRGQG